MDERRYTSGPVELRAADGNARSKIAGYAALFNSYSRDLGGFVEQVASTAFDPSKATDWAEVVCRYNHDDRDLLGSIAGGTLSLTVDRGGLHYVVTPPESRADVVELVGRGDVSRSSFAFRTLRGGDEWTLRDDGMPLRTLRSVELVDVAPVISPAYPDTTSGLRSLAAHVDAPLADVRALATQHQLRKLFPNRTSGLAAAVAIQARRFDPHITG